MKCKRCGAELQMKPDPFTKRANGEPDVMAFCPTHYYSHPDGLASERRKNYPVARTDWPASDGDSGSEEYQTK